MLMTQAEYGVILNKLPKTEAKQLSMLCLHLLKEYSTKVHDTGMFVTPQEKVLKEIMTDRVSDFANLYMALGNVDHILLNKVLGDGVVDNVSITGIRIVASSIGSYYSELLDKVKEDIRISQEAGEPAMMRKDKTVMVGELYYNLQCLQSLTSLLD